VQAMIREMPDALRLDRRLYRHVVKAYCPPLPFATMEADDDDNGFLRSEAYSAWMSRELEGAFCASALPPAFRTDLMASLRAPANGSARSMRAAVKRVVSPSWIQALRARFPPSYPKPWALAFRAALASRLVALLEADSAFLASPVPARRPMDEDNQGPS
jgi:hypothetical protein